MDYYADDLAQLIEKLDLKNIILAGFSTVVRPLELQFFQVLMDLCQRARCLGDLAASVLRSTESWTAYLSMARLGAAQRRLALWFLGAGNAGRCFCRCSTAWRSLSMGSARECASVK